MAVIPADVAATLGRPAPVEDSVEYVQWSLWITDARRLIQARLGDLDELDQGNLDFVVREAVALRAQRPDAATSTTVSIDDGSVTKRYETSTGQVSILPTWWDLLKPGEGREAFSTRPGFEPDWRSDWCWPGWTP